MTKSPLSHCFSALLAGNLFLLTGCLEQGILLNKPGALPAVPTTAQKAPSRPLAPDQNTALSISLPKPTATPESTPAPTATPTPTPTGLPAAAPSATPGAIPGPQALRLILTPSKYQLAYAGDKASFHVQIIDKQGNLVDPASQQLVWSIDKPDFFRLLIQGAGCDALAQPGGGFAKIFVELANDPSSKVSADISISAGGSGGGGAAPAPVPTPTPEPTPTPVPALTAPVIDASDFAYAGGSDGKLYAFDSADTALWSFSADGAISHNPAALGAQAASRLYFGTDAGSFYGLSFAEGASSNDGSSVWRASIGAPVTTAPLVSETYDLVAFGDSRGQVHGYTLAGAERWSVTPGSNGPMRSSPVMNGGNRIYVATADGKVCEMNPDGEVNTCQVLNPDEQAPTGAALVASPALFDTRYLTIGSQDGRLYLLFLSDDGGFDGIDSFELGTPISNPAAVSSNDVIYQPIDDKLYAVEANDGMRDLAGWPQPVTVCPGSRIVGAPLLNEQGDETLYAYVSCTDGRLYQLDANSGAILASQTINGDGSKLVDGPSFFNGPDGAGSQVRLGAANGKVQSFAAEGMLLNGTLDGTFFMWSLFRHDSYNTGVYPIDLATCNC